MENGAATQSGEGKDPSSFLSEIIGNPVTVKLNSGVVYKGECPIHLLPNDNLIRRSQHMTTTYLGVSCDLHFYVFGLSFC